MKKVAVIMGSDSDWAVVQKAVKILKSYDIPCEVHVMSAHRTPMQACEFAAGAKQNGFGVIIAAAGMAAHLAGVLAAHTTIPVIGIPIQSAGLGGLDALLATVQIWQRRFWLCRMKVWHRSWKRENRKWSRKCC